MKINIAITDSRIDSAAERKLTLLGYRVITLPPFSKLSDAVASHPDMLIKRIDNEYISYADYCEEASYVFSDLSLLSVGTGARFTFTADEVRKEYPGDVGLNALEIGGKLFCRTKSASHTLIESAKLHGLTIVNVNQGYPACTVLKLSETAAVTSDEGMAKILTENGIRVTLVRQGHISLPPHEYGFIGGAGTVKDGQLFFFGDPLLHPDGEKIVSAAKAEGLRVIPLSDTPLRDLGGILFAEGNID